MRLFQGRRPMVCLAQPGGLGRGIKMHVRAEGLAICIGLASRTERNDLRSRSRIESRSDCYLGGTDDSLSDINPGPAFFSPARRALPWARQTAWPSARGNFNECRRCIRFRFSTIWQTESQIKKTEKLDQIDHILLASNRETESHPYET